MELEKSLGVLCRFVTLTRVTAKDIFLNECGHVRPPVVALHELERAVFTRVSGGGGVVTCLDDFTAEFVVVWNVQFAIVIQQTVEILPFEYAVGEMSRAFLLQDFKGLSDFSFAFGAFAYAFFEGRSLSEDERGGSDGLEVLRFENDAILVIIGVGDLMLGKAREGISAGLCRTGFVDQFEVEFGEV